jgi:hypothetical protein
MSLATTSGREIETRFRSTRPRRAAVSRPSAGRCARRRAAALPPSGSAAGCRRTSPKSLRHCPRWTATATSRPKADSAAVSATYAGSGSSRFPCLLPFPRYRYQVRSSSCVRSPAVMFNTSARRRPVRVSVRMIARSRRPTGVSGITASSRRMSSAVSPRGGRLGPADVPVRHRGWTRRCRCGSGNGRSC